MEEGEGKHVVIQQPESVMGPISLEEGWALLDAGINQLVELVYKGGEDVKMPAELKSRLYTLVYNMCTQKSGLSLNDQLYKRHGMKVDAHCREKVAPTVRGLRGEKLLEELLHQWTMYKRLISWLSAIFAYVDRHYAVLLQMMSLSDTALNSFRLLVLDPVNEDASQTIQNQIKSSRKGEDVDLQTAAGVLQIYVDVGRGKLFFYQRDFEEQFLRDTKAFFRAEKDRLASLHPSGEEFKAKAKEVIEKETQRAKQIMHPTTEAKVVECASGLLA